MYTQHAHCVLLIFITGSKFQLVSNFTELHALTLAACSYALLREGMNFAAPSSLPVLVKAFFVFSTTGNFKFVVILKNGTCTPDQFIFCLG